MGALRFPDIERSDGPLSIKGVKQPYDLLGSPHIVTLHEWQANVAFIKSLNKFGNLNVHRRCSSYVNPDSNCAFSATEQYTLGCSLPLDASGPSHEFALPSRSTPALLPLLDSGNVRSQIAWFADQPRQTGSAPGMGATTAEFRFVTNPQMTLPAFLSRRRALSA